MNRGVQKNRILFFRTDSFIFVCRNEICHGNYGKNWGRLSTFSINSVLSIHYLIPLTANNFHANMARKPLCMSLHFLYKFSSLFYYSGHLCTIGACDHYAPTREPFLFMPALALVCQKSEKDNSVTNFEIQLRHLKNVRLPFTRSCTRFDNSN